MAEKLILAETTYTLNQGALDVIPAPFVLVEGETYRVVLDSTDYELVCVNVSGIAALFHIVGEYGDATEGSFRIGFVPPEVAAVDGGVLTMQIVSEEQTHTLAIYQIIAEDTDYLIKKSTLTAIANSIRAKTGTTDLIKVSDMASTIETITGGGSGGSSEDVRYVTFMSHDGSVEYGKKAVAVGDDCADPINRGVFNTPTRESDAQYNYTFAGWATTPNGGLDSNALKAVTEDRTVYANYIAAIRYYTITYYDGDTVLKTESLAYGSMPVYVAEKKDYNFEGWSPELAVVTGNASYYAQWSEKLTFAGASWAQIAEISASGNAANMFAVGDVKTVPIAYADGTTDTISVVIAGFGVDDLTDGGKAGITMVCRRLPKYTVKWGTLSTSYKDTAINTALQKNGAIWNMLPSELTAAIKNVDKKYDINQNSGTNPTLSTLSAPLWALSICEWGHSENAQYYAPGTEYISKLGNIYPLYPVLDIRNQVGTNFVYFDDGDGSSETWTRSVRRLGEFQPVAIKATTASNGTKSYLEMTSYSMSSYASKELSVCFGFCI